MSVSCHKQTSAPSRAPNAIPVRNYERVVDDVKYIRATIEHSKAGAGGAAPRAAAAVRPSLGQRVATPANHLTEIYWFARSAAAVAMYFE
jgi:hypothetical protein